MLSTDVKALDWKGIEFFLYVIIENKGTRRCLTGSKKILKIISIKIFWFLPVYIWRKYQKVPSFHIISKIGTTLIM